MVAIRKSTLTLSIATPSRRILLCLQHNFIKSTSLATDLADDFLFYFSSSLRLVFKFSLRSVSLTASQKGETRAAGKEGEMGKG